MYGLWRGGTATVLRNSSVVGSRFYAFGAFSHALERRGVAAHWIPAAAGFLAGALTTVASHPLDVLKTRMNNLAVPVLVHIAPGRGASQQSNIDVIKFVWRDQGATGFTAGLGARLVKISLGQAVIFTVYTRAMAALS